jgi:hypothetical protein
MFPGSILHKKKGKDTFQILDDKNVVSYNPFLTLKYATHCNVEYVFGQKACKYIFKYIMKGWNSYSIVVVHLFLGFDKCYVERRDKTTVDYCELQGFLSCRYMASQEGFMRNATYPIVQPSHKVEALEIHEPDRQNVLLDGDEPVTTSTLLAAEKVVTKLTAFFELCRTSSEARKFTYDEIPLNYTY